MIRASFRRSLPDFVLDVTFSLAPGETLVFQGESGAGKTSILECLAGLTEPASGTIVINQVLVWSDTERINLSPQVRAAGFVFQDTALFPHMSALDNVAFAVSSGFRRRHEAVPQKKAVAALAERELARLGIAHLAQARPRMLSGGERQRLALARALAAQPSLLLLDEPFSALDRATREEMWRVVADLKKAASLSLVLVTHDQEEARVLGDRILRIDRGVILDDA